MSSGDVASAATILSSSNLRSQSSNHSFQPGVASHHHIDDQSHQLANAKLWLHFSRLLIAVSARCCHWSCRGAGCCASQFLIDATTSLGLLARTRDCSQASSSLRLMGISLANMSDVGAAVEMAAAVGAAAVDLGPGPQAWSWDPKLAAAIGSAAVQLAAAV